MADNEKAFKWSGIDKKGKRVEGTTHAADTASAESELKSRGIEVTSITEKKEIQIFTKRKVIGPQDILLFTRYLSTMVQAGLPIVQSLEIISRDTENPEMRELLVKVKNSVTGGKTLADSFGEYPEQFNELYVNLIKAGEKSGTLDRILVRLGTYLERTEMLKRKVKKALIYPIAIVTVAFVVTLILLVFVVPRFEKIFSSFGAELPFFTQVIVNLSNFIQSYWWLMLLVIVGGSVGLVKYIKKSKEAQYKRDKIILRIYLVGIIIKKSIIARFARTLAITLEAGMPIVEAMRAMSALMGNKIYSDGINKICDDLTSGKQLSAAMTSSKLFPNMTVQMIAVGEASGKLTDMLNKIADYYEDDVNNIVDNLSSLLEPLIMAVLGVIIGSFVIAMYLPIFKIGSLF